MEKSAKLRGTYHVLDFTGVGVHATGRLSGLNISPDHGHHVALVVHEAGIKVGRLVRVGALDVSASSREGVLQEVEHGEKLSGGPFSNQLPVITGIAPMAYMSMWSPNQPAITE